VPTSFYTMACHELSGRGYGSYLEMYDYLLNLRRRFVRFWIDRVYYNDPSVLVNFITGDENVFRSRSLVPPNYWQGIALTVFYIILLSLASYLLFKRSLYHVTKKEIAKLGPVEVTADRGQCSVKLIKGNRLNKVLYPVLAGKSRALVKKGLQGSIRIAGKDVLQEREGQGFVYHCRPQELPAEIKAKHWLNFHCRWNHKSRGEARSLLGDPAIEAIKDKNIEDLEEPDAFALSLKLLEVSAGSIWLLNDLTGDMIIKEIVPFKDRVDRLNSEGATVIYLTRPQLVEMKLIADDKYFADGLNWSQMVAGAQVEAKLENRKKSSPASKGKE
jgi:hypothetical protein